MTRSTKRIEPTFDAIRKLWYQYPDLRLGQLLENVIPEGKDLFYVEEEDLVQYIEDYYTEHVRGDTKEKLRFNENELLASWDSWD